MTSECINMWEKQVKGKISFSSVSIVDFGQVNDCWVGSYNITSKKCYIQSSQDLSMLPSILVELETICDYFCENLLALVGQNGNIFKIFLQILLILSHEITSGKQKLLLSKS